MAVEFTEFPSIPRLSREVIITEKLDGSNGCIFIGDEGLVLAGSRTRWLIDEDNHGFALWVYKNREQLRVELGPGRHFGEWWGHGIQRQYGLAEKRFSLFNVTRWGAAPLTLCSVVPVLYRGMFDTVIIKDVLNTVQRDGSRAAPGFMRPEGIVIYHTAGNVMFKKTIEKDEGKTR